MKNMINTIGKIIHTLVKENTMMYVVKCDLLSEIPFLPYFMTLLGKYVQCCKKRLAGRSFFQNWGSQGPGGVSPGGSLRAAPSSHFSCCFEA